MEHGPVTWNEKGELVPLDDSLLQKQLAEAAREFETNNTTKPDPKMVDIDTSPKSILLAIWYGTMECLEIVLQLNRWWPGRKERL